MQAPAGTASLAAEAPRNQTYAAGIEHATAQTEREQTDRQEAERTQHPRQAIMADDSGMKGVHVHRHTYKRASQPHYLSAKGPRYQATNHEDPRNQVGKLCC
jgi:hypothetical protein